MSGVWSCNEWDQLEEIIVGNPLNARFPTADRSTQLQNFTTVHCRRFRVALFQSKLLKRQKRI